MGIEDIFTFNGVLGSILLATCAAPLAYRAYHDGHSDGVDTLFLLIWTLGEIFTLSYVIYTLDLPLILNYGLNLMFIGVVVYFKIKPRGLDEKK